MYISFTIDTSFLISLFLCNKVPSVSVNQGQLACGNRNLRYNTESFAQHSAKMYGNKMASGSTAVRRGGILQINAVPRVRTQTSHQTTILFTAANVLRTALKICAPFCPLRVVSGVREGTVLCDSATHFTRFWWTWYREVLRLLLQ